MICREGGAALIIMDFEIDNFIRNLNDAKISKAEE